MVKFDKIFVISLSKKRPNKFQEFIGRLPSCWSNDDITLLDAVDGSNIELPVWWNQNLKGAYGCLMSHVSILKEIGQCNYTNTLIFEDDAIFCNDFENKLDAVFKELPPDWNQLYLGGQHLQKPISVNNVIVKGTNINRTHCYAINNGDTANKCLDHLLKKDFWIQNLTRNKYHIDYAYGWMHKQHIINAYAAKPFLVGQQTNQYSDTGSQISKVDRWWN